jgi:hypothetical protein
MFQLEDDRQHPLAERFRAFVKARAFPCVGAKSAIGRGQMKFIVARDIQSSWDDLRIYSALLQFAIAYCDDPKLFQSFVVLFEQPAQLTEDQFERANRSPTCLPSTPTIRTRSFRQAAHSITPARST